MPDRPRRSSAPASQVVTVRRVALLTRQPEFVRANPTGVRTWIESLESRRVLSSSATAAVGIVQPIGVTDPIAIDLNVDDSGDASDSTDTTATTNDGSDVVADDQPTTEVWTSTTFIDVVDDNGTVVQSLKVVSTDFGDGAGEDPAQYEQLTADELDASQTNLQPGQSVVTTYDDNGDTVILAAVPTAALPGTWVDQTTRIATDDAELVAQRDAYDAEIARENTPTDQASQTTQYVDVVDDAGTVVQSFRITATVFGDDSPNAADVSYLQISAGDTSWLIPATLAEGASATWTWDADTGEAVPVDGVPATAIPYTEYDSATGIATDDPQLVAQRNAYNQPLTNDPNDWTDGVANGFGGDPPYICYFPAASGGAIRSAGRIETMLADPVSTTDPATIVTVSPTPTTPGTLAPVPLPSLPAAADRPLSDVLTIGKKHDDVLDPADASLIALVR